MTPAQPKLPPVDLAALEVLNKEYPDLFNTGFYAVEQGKKIMDDHTGKDGSPSLLLMTFQLGCASTNRLGPSPLQAEAVGRTR